MPRPEKQPDGKQKRLEQLVSYLDNELDDAQMQALEERMRRDMPLRRQAEVLDRTWGMLDVLEPVSASEHFSMQTMQTVRATSLRTSAKRTGRPIRALIAKLARSRALAWFGLGIGGTLLGLLIARMAAPEPESARAVRILRELEMLNRYPEYSAVRDLESLRQLQLVEPSFLNEDSDRDQPADHESKSPQ